MYYRHMGSKNVIGAVAAFLGVFGVLLTTSIEELNEFGVVHLVGPVYFSPHLALITAFVVVIISGILYALGFSTATDE